MSIQEGTIGATILATVKNTDGSPRDISDATVKKFVFRKPDGSKMSVDVPFFTNGQDGKLLFTTAQISDTQPAGNWRLQSYHEQPGFKGLSKVGTFWVLRNLFEEVP